MLLLIQTFLNAANGYLSDTVPATLPIYTGDSTPQSITIDASGKFVYVANQGGSYSTSVGTISQFSIGIGGVLSAPKVTLAGSLPYAVATAVSIQ